jgi:hypothetical protein
MLAIARSPSRSSIKTTRGHMERGAVSGVVSFERDGTR